MRPRLVTAALAALTAAATIASPAHASHVEPVGAGAPAPSACRPGHVPEVGFTDIAGNTHERTIRCLTLYGVSGGTTPTTFSPAQAVRRDQMASLLVRALTALRVTLPAGQGRFDDLEGNVHREAVERLAAAGVVQGIGPRTFGPSDAVTRAQMATFLLRSCTATARDCQPAGAERQDYFSDDAGSLHEPNINAAFEARLVVGTRAPVFRSELDGGSSHVAEQGLYDPARPVRRDQVASFVARYLERGLFLGPGSNSRPYTSDQEVPLRDGWSLQVVGYDDDATAEVRLADPGNTGPPEAGYRYIIYRVRATYRGSGTARFDGAQRLVMRSNTGDTAGYTDSIARADGGTCGDFPFPLPNEPVSANGYVEGNLCYTFFIGGGPHHIYDSRWSVHPAWPHFTPNVGIGAPVPRFTVQPVYPSPYTPTVTSR